MKTIEELHKISEEKTDISYKMHETVKEALIKIKQKNNLARETDGAYKKQIESEIDEYINEQLSVIDGYVNILPTDKMHIKISSNKYNLYSFIKKIAKTIVNYNVNNIEFKIAYVEYLPKYLLGDYIHLKQVIMSILINELRITKFGSIKVNFNGVTSYDLCKLMITIENSGRNMEIEEINNILNQEINYEDDYDYSTLNKLNIDLPTTFKIIKMLGGTMNITSNKESGTKINIILNQKIADIPLLNDESLAIKNKKVLVIDDNIGEKNKIRNILNKLGYSVETSLYEEDAIYKIINKNKYDVIIIDDYLTSTSADIVLKKICNYDTSSKKIVLLDEKNFDKVNYYLKKGFTTYIKKDNLKEELNKVDKLIKSGK